MKESEERLRFVSRFDAVAAQNLGQLCISSDFDMHALKRMGVLSDAMGEAAFTLRDKINASDVPMGNSLDFPITEVALTDAEIEALSFTRAFTGASSQANGLSGERCSFNK